MGVKKNDMGAFCGDIGKNRPEVIIFKANFELCQYNWEN